MSAINTLNTIFLIISICLVSAAAIHFFYDIYLSKNAKAAKGKKTVNSKLGKTAVLTDFLSDQKIYGIALAAVAVIGIIIRVWKFGSVPGGFNQDGAMAAVDGKALADYATDRFGTWLPAHLYAWGYGQMSSLLSYIIAIFVKFFGLSPITARLPQLLASLMGGTFFYLFLRDTFGKSAAFIGAVFTALNPWHLVQSRWALDCNLLPHFFIGGLYFLNRGLSKKTEKSYISTYISMIFFGLCMYCYGIAIYTIPVFLLAAAVYYFIKKRIKLSQLLISLGIYLLIAWPFILTMAVNFFKWDTIKLPFVTIQYFSGSVRSSDILMFSDNPIKQLAANFKSMLNTTLWQKKDLPWNDIEGFGTMFLCTMPFVFAGFIEFFRTKTAAPKGIALFALLIGIWAGLLTNGVNVNRINIVYYGIMIFAVLGMRFVITEIKYTDFMILGIYAVLGAMLVSTYFTDYAEHIKGYFYYGFGEALEAAEDSGAQRIYVTADAQGEGYANVSEILTLFYDKTDALYFQGKTDTNNGKELWPYNQRFIYKSMTQQIADETKTEDAAYVIMYDDAQFFDTDVYDITEYGNFCSVIKK